MNTPQWLESEQQRIKREMRVVRCEVALGVTCAVVWAIVIAEAALRLLR